MLCVPPWSKQYFLKVDKGFYVGFQISEKETIL